MPSRARPLWLLAAGAGLGAALTAWLRRPVRIPRTPKRTGPIPVSREPAVALPVPRPLPVTPLLVVLAALLVVAAATYAGWEFRESRKQREEAMRVTGGDPSRAPALIVRYGCGGCHTIPGVTGANGLVGPPLQQVAKRVYLAGILTNTPANMISWIENPRAHDARTAMPVTGISRAEARHVAAYLYALR